MSTETKTMQPSWLVQRLEKPRTSGLLLGKDNPFAFGGGLRNGGLSGEAMDVLRDIFSFDYMGAAEFEFGAVPKALNDIREHAVEGTLTASEFAIPLRDVAKGFREKGKTPTGEASVYLLARDDQSDEAEVRIREWAKQGYASHLKESTRLDSTLRPSSEYDGGVVGWLELDNGFFFFTDREMWQQTAALFGVEVAS